MSGAPGAHLKDARGEGEVEAVGRAGRAWRDAARAHALPAAAGSRGRS